MSELGCLACTWIHLHTACSKLTQCGKQQAFIGVCLREEGKEREVAWRSWAESADVASTWLPASLEAANVANFRIFRLLVSVIRG